MAIHKIARGVGSDRYFLPWSAALLWSLTSGANGGCSFPPEGFESINPSHPHWLGVLQHNWQDVAWIIPQINPGAAWSIGSGTPWLIVALTVVLVPGISLYYWFQIRHLRRIWEHLAFALIIGGALGNAWDRLISAASDTYGYGGVRDFIHVDLNVVGISYIWPTFNIADSGITVGAVIAIAASLLSKPAQQGGTAVSPAENPANPSAVEPNGGSYPPEADDEP